jgi:Domain of unknown function (DUF4129)
VEFKDISKPLAEVASQYHFHQPAPALLTLREYLAKLLRWLNELWHNLFNHGGSSLDSKSISLVMQILIVVAFVVAVGAAVYHLLKHIRSQSAEKLQTIRGATAIEVIESAAGWKAQAEKLAGSRDYRGACRALYLSLLQTLDENKIAPFAPTKTNYEYSYALAPYPQLQHEFRQLADLVEVVWFGNKEADADDYTRWLFELNKLAPDIKATASARQAQEKTP